MDLQKQPLYALRDLAARLDIKAPTACTKPELLRKIEERKIEIEEKRAAPNFNTRGRPRLNNAYIGIRIDENGKLDFFEKNQTPLFDDISGKLKELFKPQIVTAKRPPAIEDEKTRENLEKVKTFLDDLSFAIKTILEN